MVLTNTANITLADAGIAALLGYAIVFFGLILLMAVIVLLGKFFIAAEKKNAPKTIAPPPAPAPAAAKPAPGSAGRLKLYNVDPKTAAMVMAIVADKLQKPLSELRFLSIKEVDK